MGRLVALGARDGSPAGGPGGQRRVTGWWPWQLGLETVVKKQPDNMVYEPPGDKRRTDETQLLQHIIHLNCCIKPVAKVSLPPAASFPRS